MLRNFYVRKSSIHNTYVDKLQLDASPILNGMVYCIFHSKNEFNPKDKCIYTTPPHYTTNTAISIQATICYFLM